MRILTSKKVSEIEKNRDIIYDYLKSNIKENGLSEFAIAKESLKKISDLCGIKSNPFDYETK